MPWEDSDDQKPGEPERPLETPELWSHVPNLESFLQELYTRSTGLSTEPTSAQFSALSARVAANSAAGGGAGTGSVTSAQFISVMAVVSQQTSALSQAISVLSNQVSVLSNLHSALSNAVSVLSQQVSALSQSVSSQAAALSVRIDTQSQGISVLSNQVSILSNLHSVLSNAVSVISQQVSALSQSLSSQAAALSVRIDTQSQGISVLSNQVSALSQAVSIISVQVVSALSIANAASAAAAAVSADLTSVRNLLSNAISVLSQQVSVISQAVSALSQAHSTLSASHVSLVDRVSANSALAGGGISIVPTPGGRLTLTSATPVMTAAVTAAVKIFYTPYNGNALPIYSGTAWVLSSLTELSMSLDSSVHTSSTNYDVFAVNDGGTRRIGTGSAWATASSRALSIQQLNGIWTNMSTFDLRYGSATVSTISANLATYLGTFRTTGTPGQTEYSFGGTPSIGGTEAKLYLWNAYNRVEAYAYIRDSTDSWTYQNTAWRAANNSSTFRVSFVRGLDEDTITVIYPANAAGITSQSDGFVGIGVDSTTAYNGLTGYMSGSTNLALAALGSYMGLPGLGYHFCSGIEACNVVTSVMTFYGDANLVQFQTGLLFTGVM